MRTHSQSPAPWQNDAEWLRARAGIEEVVSLMHKDHHDGPAQMECKLMTRVCVLPAACQISFCGLALDCQTVLIGS